MLYYVVVDLLAMSILSGSLVLMSVRVQKKNYNINVDNRHLPVSNKCKPLLNKADIKILVLSTQPSEFFLRRTAIFFLKLLIVAAEIVLPRATLEIVAGEILL